MGGRGLPASRFKDVYDGVMDLTQEFRRVDRLPLSRSEALPRFPGWQTLYAMHASGDGIVYRATPEGSDSADADYVVKTLSRDAAQRPDRRAAFQREAIAAGAVRHAHLVPVLDGDLRGERPFLVFPFLEGSTLRQAVSHRMPLSLPAALWTIRQAAEALIALHGAGFAHLDVKPENVHLSPRGHVTLLDLGSARRLGDGAGDYSGDIAYTAPELWSSACVVDATADVYSLGLTAYEALAGVSPCQATSADDWIAFHRECESLDLREYLPNLPVELVQLLQAMLRKTPARRPSLEEVRDELVRMEIGSFGDRRSLLRPFDPEGPKTSDAPSARKSRSPGPRSASTSRASRVG